MSRSSFQDRAAILLAIETDVGRVLDEAGGANAAVGRLLVRLTGGTPVENASALRDLLSAAQQHTIRAVLGGRAA
jgi:hypothetical protein